MAVDVSKITDPGLAAALQRLGEGVERKHNKSPRRLQPRQGRGRHDWLLNNGSQEQAHSSHLEHTRRQGGDK